MDIVDSPRPEYTHDGKPQERPGNLTIIRRVLIGGVLVISLILNIVLWSAGRPLAADDPGVLQGTVVNADGIPVAGALVFLSGAPEQMVTTASNGTFLLENAPSGRQTLVVVRSEIGQTYAVELTENAVNKAGTLSHNAPADFFSGYTVNPQVSPQITRAANE